MWSIDVQYYCYVYVVHVVYVVVCKCCLGGDVYMWCSVHVVHTVLVYVWYYVHVVHDVLWACGTIYVHCVVVVSSHVYSLFCTLCSTCILFCCMPSVGTCIMWHCTSGIDV